MVLLAYGGLILGIPGLCIWAALALDGTPWPGRLFYIIPATLLGVFVFLILKYAPRRRATHLVLGVVLVPVMWVITALILGAVLISPARLDGIR
jgi:uncharacterized BrkB/YihY/UPF0761 family membrane protein